jgi:hypothetical protein
MTRQSKMDGCATSEPGDPVEPESLILCGEKIGRGQTTLKATQSYAKLPVIAVPDWLP